MKRFTALLLSCLLLLATAACGSQTETEDTSAEEEEAEAVVEVEEEEEAEAEEEETVTYLYTNPLTGEGTETDLSQNRPIAAMLNTLKKALPQSGSSSADMLIEIPEEGGITRIMALFQDVSEVGNLGTIRSTREYFVYLAMGFDALLVHAGTSTTAEDALNAYSYTTLDYMSHGSLYWRDAERKASLGTEHSLYTSGELLSDYLDTTSIRTTHSDSFTSPYTFTEDGTPSGGASAQSIEVVFSGYKTTTFTYDEESGTYLVSFFEGDAYMDENTGTQVAVTNVIIVPTTQSTKSDGLLQEFDLSSGTGYYACGGQYIQISWSKGGNTSPIVFTQADGSQLDLGVGKTYICILDSDQPVTFQ